MKKAWMAVLLLGGIFLTGCRADRPVPSAGPASGAENRAELGVAGAESGCLGPISPDSISQGLYDALRDEWDSWNSLSDSQKIISSHMPGNCRRDFDSWEECGEFLGFSISNPLEECAWLEKGTYVAMPEGFMDAPRVEVSWYGTQDGHVEWINVQAGYRDGQVRVMLRAILYGDPADTKSRDEGWTLELERLDYLENADSSPLQVTSESTENYFASIAYQARGPVLYCFNVVGEPDGQAQVERTLEQVVGAFFPESN